ncbi:MAG TPA: hypothetical protein VLH38_01510 [Patescibacteria group bacterium]|nr:hypothetical protein [Patescibacteria group bacterium]
MINGHFPSPSELRPVEYGEIQRAHIVLEAAKYAVDSLCTFTYRGDDPHGDQFWDAAYPMHAAETVVVRRLDGDVSERIDLQRESFEDNRYMLERSTGVPPVTQAADITVSPHGQFFGEGVARYEELAHTLGEGVLLGERARGYVKRFGAEEDTNPAVVEFDFTQKNHLESGPTTIVDLRLLRFYDSMTFFQSVRYEQGARGQIRTGYTQGSGEWMVTDDDAVPEQFIVDSLQSGAFARDLQVQFEPSTRLDCPPSFEEWTHMLMEPLDSRNMLE